MAGTKDQQRAEIVEGLALGLTLLGIVEIPSGKVDFELAISGALRRWDSSSAYPSILRAHKPDNELWIGLRKSQGRRSASFRFFDLGPTYVIKLPAFWDADDEDDPIVGNRPNAQWKALAEHFASWDGWSRKYGRPLL